MSIQRPIWCCHYHSSLKCTCMAAHLEFFIQGYCSRIFKDIWRGVNMQNSREMYMSFSYQNKTAALFKNILTLWGMNLTTHDGEDFMFISSCALNESGLLCTTLHLGIIPRQCLIYPWVILVCRCIVNKTRWWASLTSSRAVWAFSC